MQIVFACCSLPFGKSEMKYEIEAKLHFFSQNIDFDCLLLYKKFSFENFEIGWKNEVLRNCSAHHASQDSLYNSGSDFLFKDFSAIIGFWSFPSWVFDNTFEARLFDPIFIKIRFPCIRPPIVSDHFNSVIFLGIPNIYCWVHQLICKFHIEKCIWRAILNHIVDCHPEIRFLA